MEIFKDNEKIKLFFDYILELSEFKEEDNDENVEFIKDSTIRDDIAISSFIEYSENLNKIGLSYVAPSFISNNIIELINIIKNIFKIHHNIDIYLQLSISNSIIKKYYHSIINNKTLFYINFDNFDNFLNKANILDFKINDDYFISVIIIIDKDFKNIKEFNMEISNISNIIFDKKQNILNFIEKIDNKNYETIEKISMLCTI